MSLSMKPNSFLYIIHHAQSIKFCRFNLLNIYLITFSVPLYIIILIQDSINAATYWLVCVHSLQFCLLQNQSDVAKPQTLACNFLLKIFSKHLITHNVNPTSFWQTKPPRFDYYPIFQSDYFTLSVIHYTYNKKSCICIILIACP